MTRPRTTEATVRPLEGASSRVSWGAVLAGAVIALMVIVVLELVMVWLGLAAIDPARDARPFEGVAIGAAIGILAILAIALFVGGLVAGRAANRVNDPDVYLHGLLTWAVVTLAGIWFTAAAISTLLSGALGVVGQGLSALGEGAAAIAPAAADRAALVLDDQRTLLEDIQEEMEPLWADPVARREFRQVTTRILRDGEPTVSEVDRQQLIEVVSTHTELSEAEAATRVDSWIDVYEEGQMQLAEAEEQLRLAGQEAADALSLAALWAVIGLVVGALLAMLGARVGAPRAVRETYTA